MRNEGRVERGGDRLSQNLSQNTTERGWLTDSERRRRSHSRGEERRGEGTAVSIQFKIQKDIERG